MAIAQAQEALPHFGREFAPALQVLAHRPGVLHQGLLLQALGEGAAGEFEHGQHLGAFGGVTARAHMQGDAFVVQRDKSLALAYNDIQQMTPTPQVMAFALHILPGCLTRLGAERGLLLARAAQAGDPA